MNRSKIYSISALALIVASIGAITAMWSETLQVNVTVSTGEVDVKWSDWGCNDTGADPQTPGGQFNNSEGKDVAHCYVEPEMWDGENDVIKLNVTIVNAYPGYRATVWLVVDNIGTIPVKLYNYTVTSINTTALDVSFDVLQGSQIHPGGNDTILLIIDVLQAAQENTTYTFEITLTYAQWNEVTGP